MNIDEIKQHPIHDLLEQASLQIPLSFSIVTNDEILKFGGEPEQFRILLNKNARPPSSTSEFAWGRAYVEGEFEIDGDIGALLDLRAYMSGKNDWRIQLGFLTDLFCRSAPRVNSKSISKHYNYDDDFYLTFIDTAYRFYSHCLFDNDEETLEAAATHKLETMFDGLGLEPGMRLLDIGAGWGGVHDYCGSRGVEVTSVTLAENSKKYTEALIQRLDLKNCQVVYQDFLQFRPDQPFDAIVIYGVIEHIPYYQKFVQKAWECLKPGGRIYMDASATLEKYDMNDFTRHYIWPGTHTFLCLQDMIQEFLFNGFEVVEAVRETKDYELTMQHWAERFDANAEKIIQQYGQEQYRAFRLYLHAGCHAFKVNTLQAYHIIAERCLDEGPRPGKFKRAWHFVRGLV